MKLQRVKIRYPWITPLMGVLIVSYSYSYLNEGVREYYQLPEEYFQVDYLTIAAALFLVSVLIEMALFSRRRKKYNSLLLKHESQIHDLFHKKNKLHHKAHTYSDHADKLKLFISDRLLEHIEYDEKFLHFKNIASEVRHNGVICYDKVITSLRLAITKSKKNEIEQYEDAVQSMLYLWDLLDLSTTDNISRYIANKLYESEEHYYQQLLNEDNKTPYSPVFDARGAVLKALQGVVDNDDKFKTSAVNGEIYQGRNAQFHLSLEGSLTLLGNENYIVLLVENLINNALYYSSLKKYRSEHARIAIRLSNDNKMARLSCYNRGPLITTEDSDQVFKLGYSTKKVRENNGKGLGLYFVHEIIKGYEGEVNFENVTNQEDTYIIRIEISGGEVQSHIVKTRLNSDGVVECYDQEEAAAHKKIQYKISEKIESIEVSPQSQQRSCSVNKVSSKDSEDIVDQHYPEHPAWVLNIIPRKAYTRIIFEPLDVRGVKFNVMLPLVESRLDSSYHEVEEGELSDIDALNQSFDENREYIS